VKRGTSRTHLQKKKELTTHLNRPREKPCFSILKNTSNDRTKRGKGEARKQREERCLLIRAGKGIGRLCRGRGGKQQSPPTSEGGNYSSGGRESACWNFTASRNSKIKKETLTPQRGFRRQRGGGGLLPEGRSEHKERGCGRLAIGRPEGHQKENRHTWQKKRLTKVRALRRGEERRSRILRKRFQCYFNLGNEGRTRGKKGGPAQGH